MSAVLAGLASSAGVRTGHAAPPATATARPKRRALFVWGGWPGHEPDKCRDRFVPWLRSQGFEVTVADSLAVYADARVMTALDLIVQIWTMGTIKKEELRGLLDAVRGGVGLAGWHGGLGDAFRQETAYQYMVGGQWVEHPGGTVDYKVNIVDHEDPITRGLDDFALRTEQYYMHVDPNNKVLATTTFSGASDFWIDGATMPVVWKRAHGKGRVFYTSLGHANAVFDTREALAITTRGMLWAAESRFENTPDLISPVYPRR
jgi:hypothetical protein